MKVPDSIRLLFVGRYPAFMWCLVGVCYMALGITYTLAQAHPNGLILAGIGYIIFMGFGKRLKDYREGKPDEWKGKGY
jgi:hypothetical protein